MSTPTAIVADVRDVRHVRAEDETGAFGIMEGHADFLTVLPVSVLTWDCGDASEGFVLVRGGILTVHDGALVEIAARGAFSRDDLASLGEEAIRDLERADEMEDISRISDTRLHLATMRQIERVLEAGRRDGSALPSLQPTGPEGEA
ncbi:F0F1 ATP synthase subunit epsilon [Roseibacterium sp. SDUM158016]|uniref:F0F1 ATP synthase subunit epsilon n=1 Tax=Roseicyclus sediminis TaxID=2980997 RepID=UPI0021D0F867|nr:F0F1 ATP synthase subunit epsilon [Roseibacterium sp. SDUM158016]MCU4651464.1 F0F1 ATP synthase subunit epsilon [Roseibacterium sp. SDUM158016]